MCKRFLMVIISLCMVLILMGCKEGYNVEQVLKNIKVENLAKNIKILSSDEFEGRFPASKGEEKTINFLKRKFQEIGLQPGNGESFFQEIPLVKITADPDMELKVSNGKKSISFSYGDEFVAVTRRVREEVSIKDSEMVFVGYGIVAPEYNWNDYKGIDVKGKTVIVLVNDPGFATKNPELFKGKAMTYYGRWTYKYEEAARQGADGVLIIHETEPAAYGWGVVKNGWTGPQFYLSSEDDNMSRCAMEGWLHIESARKIFALAGKDFDELKKSASSREFKATPLNLKTSVKIKNQIERLKSNNVIAVLPGRERKNEYIIYVAHWDHLGKNPELEGDQIFNGALDNATGVAGLIELAKAFEAVNPPPLRSIVFLAVTCEEQGLLGSEYYATYPIYPLTKTVAVINIDTLNIYGKMKDITIVGYGNSELDDYVKEIAQEQGRVVRPDPAPEKGSFYRSDHFSFTKKGVPSLYLRSGVNHIKFGEKWTLAKVEEYIREKYHKPSDEFDPSWDLTGAVEDLCIIFKVGYKLSRESTFPNWREGCEFKPIRDKAMKEAKVKI